MELNIHLSASDGDPLSYSTRYHHLVGSLVYLAVTRSDISYPVHILSHFVSTPTLVHYSHLLCVLRYLCGTMVFSFLVQALYSFKPIRMLRGLVILPIAVHFMFTVFFLVVHSLLGRQRNKLQFLVRVQRLSCKLWLS